MLDKIQIRRLILIFVAFFTLSGCDWMFSEAYLNIRHPLVDPSSFQDNAVDAAINPYLIEGVGHGIGRYTSDVKHFSNKSFKRNLIAIKSPTKIEALIVRAGGQCSQIKSRAFCLYRKIVWSLDPMTNKRKAITNMQECHNFQFSFLVNVEVTEETLKYKYTFKRISVSSVNNFPLVEEECRAFSENSRKIVDPK